MMRIISTSALFITLIPGLLCGQSRPFPQNADYPYGHKTSVISTQVVQNAYNRWKNSFLRSCSGMYRVCSDDTTITISEGMGYGMLLTAYYGEKEYFDGLLRFYKSKRTPEAYNLMGWKVTCGGIVDPGSATDGDLDVAFALIVAYCQWGERYRAEADSILTILKEHYFVTCSSVTTMKPGGQFGGCGLTDISYYTPAYFRLFGQIAKDPFWDMVADDSYTILLNGANDSTGLVPDWQSYDGIPGGNPASGRDDYYHYDACRTPWRMSLDFLWNGNTVGQSWCKQVSDFANSIGAANIVSGYDLNGTVRGQYNNSSFVGGFAVGAMCNSQSIVDNFARRLLLLDGPGYDNQYFNLSLRCLYMLVLTGNFWKPEISDDYIGQPLPAKMAQKFAEDIVSREDVHSRLVVSPDGKETLWNTYDSSTFATRIMHVTYDNGTWSVVDTPSFAQNGVTANPLFSPDGKKLFFNYRSNVDAGWTIKYVDKTDSGWSEPRADGFLLNTMSSFAKTGKVYFSDMSGLLIDRQIYSAHYSDTAYADTLKLDEAVNSPYIDYTPFISPDEDYLLFASSRPSTSEDNMYLYVSFKQTDGTWSTPQNIHNAISFSGKARFPSISPDGKYLFFCGDDGNIYWVGIQAITELNPTEVQRKTPSPASIVLYQNFPNPFNPKTVVSYKLPVTSRLTLKVYDILGREVATLVDERKESGAYSTTFDGAGLASGVYIMRLSATPEDRGRPFVQVKKMLLLK